MCGSEGSDADFGKLIRSAREGDREALMKLLFDSHQPLLASIQAKLGQKLLSTISADDILQETFIAAMRSIERQENDDRASFLAWLRTIASNRIRDAARAKSSKKRGGDRKRVQTNPDPCRSTAANLLEEFSKNSVTPSRIVAKDEAVNAMQVAMSLLPEDQRKALLLHHFERLSLEDTAKAMGRTTGSVRGLIQRAKENLRDHMDSASKWLSQA